jgi:hypothetical protein
LLDIVFLRFAESGQWPCADGLQRELVRRSNPLDVLGEAQELPGELGWIGPDQRIVLTPRALAHVSAARDLLDDYLCVVALAFSRYRDGQGAVCLTAAEIAPSLKLSSARAARTVGLMKSAPDLFSASGPDDADGVLSVSPQIRHFSSVKGLDDYLKIERRLSRKTRRDGANPLRQRVRRWFGKSTLTVLDKIAIGLLMILLAAIGTVGLNAMIADDPSPDRRVPTPGLAEPGKPGSPSR